MLKSASTNAYASSSRVTLVGRTSSSSRSRRSISSIPSSKVELNSPSFLPPSRRPSPSRRAYSSSLATTSTEPTSSLEPPLSPYTQKKLARQARLQPLARRSILPPSLQRTTLPPSSILLQHPIVATPVPPPTSAPLHPLVTLFPPKSTLKVDLVVVDPPVSLSPSPPPPPRPVKVSSSMTPAELDKHYNWTDEQVVQVSKHYPKKVLKGNPSVQVMRRRLLVQKLFEIAGSEKAKPTRTELARDDESGNWKQWMGLRGVPVISKWPTTHPTKAVGIWGVKQTSELDGGDRYPPSSGWVGATAVTSSHWRTVRQSSPLHIQFIRRLPSLASARMVQGPTLAPTSSQLPHIPDSFQPPIRVGLPPIYVLGVYPPHPDSTSTAARTAAFLSNFDPDPTARRRKIEVSAPYCSELLRLASAPDVTDETREMVEKYMMLKMRKAGLVGWEEEEGKSEEVMGKKAWRRGKRERVVVEMDAQVGKKGTHPTAPRRNKARRKMREALRMVLMDEHSKGSKSMLKWRGYTYVLRPTGQVTQIPMDRLTEYVRESLMKVCSKFNYAASVAGGSQQRSSRPPQQQQEEGRIDPRPLPQKVKPPRGGLGPTVAGSRAGGAFQGGSGSGGKDWRAGR